MKPVVDITDINFSEVLKENNKTTFLDALRRCQYTNVTRYIFATPMMPEHNVCNFLS